MPHTMTLRVYRLRPGGEPTPLTPVTTVRVEPDAFADRGLLAQLLSADWGPCRCPRHRVEADR
ncbi:hypothetical protein [Streptomyces sp. NPDC057702]|uniref:hypothetical protein n=1 Tax=unclassified Streptomyces TaxID=2593676 RepID=UPI003683F573